ncbi:MAG: ParB/RepB/Spo0J family partition protein [Gammaproteobacteria bacterium]|nr:ParB/RepB/Spo0J family partition protein [Gammaproteobacteria bacterium]
MAEETRSPRKAASSKARSKRRTRTPAGAPSAPAGRRPVESFDPADVRPWRYHNRSGSGMDEASIGGLADSIRREGQQQPGLARRLPAGESHAVEVIFGVRRLEACRRAGVRWQAEVQPASLSDVRCAALMHIENANTESISPLENAVQWRAMLDDGLFANQTALADELGCHRGTVARAVRTARALFEEEWLARLVAPVMHEFSGRAADRLADAYAIGARRQAARRRAAEIEPGTVSAQGLYDALYGGRSDGTRWRTVFVRRRGQGGGGGAVAARIKRNEAGSWSVTVQAHEQSPTDYAELAEQVEKLVHAETASAASVRLGRKIAATLSAEAAKEADRAWLEGCLWASAQAMGLEWDRMGCALAAQILINQPDGWERAVAQVAAQLESAATPI